jgi:hypothetical protein
MFIRDGKEEKRDGVIGEREGEKGGGKESGYSRK